MTALVAYASKYGATREIAERIVAVLQRAGVAAEARAADEVASVRPYEAVVLGSGVYSAGWLPAAAEFLESFRDELSSRSVWLFSVGPSTSGDPHEALGGWTFPAALRGLAEALKPRGIMLFAGKIDPERLDLDDWLIIRSMRGQTGDFRNWQAIENWARNIACSLQRVETL